MSTKREVRNNPASCWNKAGEHEPVFVLLGRDVVAPNTIRFWATKRVQENKNEEGDAQITGARAVALEMEHFQSNGSKQYRTAWLIQKEIDGVTHYIKAEHMLNWTPSINDALQLARGEDAHALCNIVEDADAVRSYEFEV